eukprot:6841174-Alexandrium_andersonii.AAC.1
MSASLVGSEMCIRDSWLVGRADDRRGEATRAAASCLLELVAGARAACPVSYTHLTLPTICSV